MLIELKRLVRTAGSVYKKVRALNQDISTASIDASPSKTFNNEMHEFYSLFKRGMTENHKLYVTFYPSPLIMDQCSVSQSDWEKIQPPSAEQIVPLDQLTDPINPSSLNKLAVLKVNGGLGTSMGKDYEIYIFIKFAARLMYLIGMTGAKGALKVKDNMTFLDLAVSQVEHLNITNDVDVPLIFMTSFNTHEETERIVEKHANRRVSIKTVKQSRFPRLVKDSLLPCPKTAKDEKKEWYPPGHGELYNTLTRMGLLDQLLNDGKEYLFVSDSDNLGAMLVGCLYVEMDFAHVVIFFLITSNFFLDFPVSIRVSCSI
jgi:UTP--glucose-1-phosphate uridylyltransferase